MRTSRTGTFTLVLLIPVTAVLIGLSLFTGGYDITPVGVLTDPDVREMFFISRVPRTLALVLAAAAMSISGVIMQTITQNPFAEPTTTGAAAWSGLGLLLILLLAPGAPLMWRMVFASVFAFLGTLIFLGILRRIQLSGSPVLVPLVGIMLGAVVGAITTYIAATTDLLQSLTAWRSGGFSSIVEGRYEPLWIVLVVVIGCIIMADRFTATGLGRDIATGIGVNYERVVLVGSAMVALATGVTTVVVGFVPFLGLVVPNAITLIRGSNTRANLPSITLLGIALLIACDLIGRVVVAPMEIPASVILGAIGAVLFIAMILYRRNRGII